MSKPRPKYGDKVMVILPKREDGVPAAMPLLPNVVQASDRVITCQVPVEVTWNAFCRRRFDRGDFQLAEGRPQARAAATASEEDDKRGRK